MEDSLAEIEIQRIQEKLDAEKSAYLNLRKRLDDTIHVMEKVSSEADRLEEENRRLRYALKLAREWISDDDKDWDVPKIIDAALGGK